MTYGLYKLNSSEQKHASVSVLVYSGWHRHREPERHVPPIQGSQEAMEDLQIRLCKSIILKRVLYLFNQL